MGTNLSAAHKVFVDMAEREKVSNFGKTFGGSQSYIHRDGNGGGGVQFGKELQSFKKWIISSLIQGLLLSNYFWSTWSTSAGMVNKEVVDLDMVLDDMVIVDQVWFRKSPNQGCKVVKIK
jgi:hypothetical protein